MSSDAGRWWSLTRRRRRVVAIATAGSGLIALIVGGAVTGWSAGLEVVGFGCLAAAVGYLVTTLGAPMVGDRPDWRDPLWGMDRRTKRRALRCIRRSDLVGAPTDVDLEQVGFYWGRRQAKSLRLVPIVVVVVVVDGLIDSHLWYQLACIAFVLTTAAVVIYQIRDMRLCRRFLLRLPTIGDSAAAEHC